MHHQPSSLTQDQINLTTLRMQRDILRAEKNGKRVVRYAPVLRRCYGLDPDASFNDIIAHVQRDIIRTRARVARHLPRPVSA